MFLGFICYLEGFNLGISLKGDADLILCDRCVKGMSEATVIMSNLT